MDLDKTIKERKSIREYKDKRVSFKLLMDLVDAALQGPYAGNMNNLKFLIVEDQSKIKQIAEYADQLWINTAPSLIIVCADEINLENQYGERGRVYSRQQAGAAIQTILLKAVDLGLASCWVGSYDDEMIRRLTGIPKHVQIEAVIPIGYEKKEKPTNKPDKHKFDGSIYWDSWRTSWRPSVFNEGHVGVPSVTNPRD